MKRLIGPLLVAILLSAVVVVPQQAQAQGSTCLGEAVTIDMTAGASGVGTSGADVILGTAAADVIDGAGGDDVICAGAGNDDVTGGDGDDSILGEDGNDIVRANAGSDFVDGGNGNDRLYGGTEDDVLIGRDGDDYLSGYGGADTIYGGLGADRIFGGFGADIIHGGVGPDTINGLVGDDIITGGIGPDVINGDRGNDTINGEEGDDVVNGGNANDTLFGGSGNDEVNGGKANDWLAGDEDTDSCAGNLDTDSTNGSCESTLGVEASSTSTPTPPTTVNPPSTPGATPTQPTNPTNPTTPVDPGEPVELPRPSNNTVAWVETFDEPSSLDNFDWAIHHGWQANVTDMTWLGDHSLDCGAPTEGRVINNLAKIDDGISYYRDTFHESAYWCRGHLMTSLNTNHYAQVDFAPKPTFTDVARVCWDQTRTDLGSRQWTQLVIVPVDTFVANDSRMDYASSRLAVNPGPGTGSVAVTGDTFLAALNRGGTQIQTGQDSYSSNSGGSWRTEDKATRYTICVEDLDNGTVRVDLEYDAGVHVRTMPGSFPEGPARVIFQDDTYNADKDLGVENGYTWHWDNIIVETN